MKKGYKTQLQILSYGS